MAFYFNNKLSVNIEDKQYTIDLSKNKVVNAINEIRSASIHIAKVKEPTVNDIGKYIDSMKKFIDEILGVQSTKDLFNDRVVDFQNLSELVQYLLIEIEKFKTQKVNKLINQNTPEKLN